MPTIPADIRISVRRKDKLDMEYNHENTVFCTCRDCTASPGFVYAIQSGEFVKIGFSCSPYKRFSDIGYSLPTEISVLAIIPTQQQRRLEKELHTIFSSKRVSGEWFSLDVNDVQKIIDMVPDGFSYTPPERVEKKLTYYCDDNFPF